MGCVFSQVFSPGTQSRVKKPGKEVNDLPATTKVVSKGRVKLPNGQVAKEEKVAGGNGSEEADKKLRPKSRPSNLPKQWLGEQVAAGWPSWLSEACGEALGGWIPRQANTFEKIDKVGCSILFELPQFFMLNYGIDSRLHLASVYPLNGQ